MNVNELGHTIRPSDVYRHVKYVEAPAGFEFTGEFRPPKGGEQCLSTAGDVLQVHVSCDFSISDPRLILRRKPRKTRIIFEPTGETRPPKHNEWFVDNGVLLSAFGSYINSYPIYTRRTEEYTD